MKGRLRALINPATGEITLPLTLTSRMARSNSVVCASLIVFVDFTGLGRDAVAELLQHVSDHHPDHDLVLDEEH